MNNGYSGIFSNPVFSNPAIPVQKRLPVYTQRAGRLGPQFNVRPTPPNWPGASVRGLSGFGALGAASITSAGSCVAYKESYAALADANVLPAVLQNLGEEGTAIDVQMWNPQCSIQFAYDFRALKAL